MSHIQIVPYYLMLHAVFLCYTFLTTLPLFFLLIPDFLNIYKSNTSVRYIRLNHSIAVLIKAA